MNLTKLQIDIIRHRLEVSDCIEECLMYDDDENLVYTEHEISKGIESVESMLNINKDWAAETLHQCAKDVLFDCVDGSTYCAASYSAYRDDEIPKKEYDAACRALEELADKVEVICGKRPNAPLG